MNWLTISGNLLILVGVLVQLLRYQQRNYSSKATAFAIFLSLSLGFGLMLWNLYTQLNSTGYYPAYRTAFWALTVSVTLSVLLIISSPVLAIPLLLTIAYTILLNTLDPSQSPWSRIMLFFLTGLIIVFSVILFTTSKGMVKWMSLLQIISVLVLNPALARAYCKGVYSNLTFSALSLIIAGTIYLTIHQAGFPGAVGWITVVLSSLLNMLLAMQICA